MNTNSILFLTTASVLVTLCLAAQTITYGSPPVALTLVPGSSPKLILEPVLLNDPTQQWNFAGGFISSADPGYTNYVLDVSGGSAGSNTPVIVYAKKSPTASNQQWTQTASGAFESAVYAGYYLTPNASNTGVVVNYHSPPPAATVAAPITLPWLCSSTGDPHISPYTTGGPNLNEPGSQQPGTFTLSKVGVKPTDPGYALVQAYQQECYPPTPIYCNEKVILSTGGQLIQIEGDTVTINGAVTVVTGTYTVAPGITITKKATSNYEVNYPTGYLEWQDIHPYGEIYLGVTSGARPSGGLCTIYTGPNVPPTRKRTALTVPQFIFSWRALNISDDLFQYASELAWLQANPATFNTSNGNWTTNNATLSATAQVLCSVLLSGSTLTTQCGPYLPHVDFYQACLDDVIATGDYAAASGTIDAFSTKCAKYAASNGTTIVLPTSGFKSIASGAGLTSPVELATATSFTIQAKNSLGNSITVGGDSFEVYSSGPSALSFTVTDLGTGAYTVTYTPTVAGTYSIAVLFRDVDSTANSPFTVSVISFATDAALSTAAGPGLGLELDSATDLIFTVTARRADGVARTTGGDTVIVGVSEAGYVESITDNGDGTYTVYYQQDEVGPFAVTVTINGAPISGSPFACATDD